MSEERAAAGATCIHLPTAEKQTDARRATFDLFGQQPDRSTRTLDKARICKQSCCLDLASGISAAFCCS